MSVGSAKNKTMEVENCRRDTEDSAMVIMRALLVKEQLDERRIEVWALVKSRKGDLKNIHLKWRIGDLEGCSERANDVSGT